MTAVVRPEWVDAPSSPPFAAPLRAVDTWRGQPDEHDGDTVHLTVRVGVRGDEPTLRGHFPGLAVFPGVFVIEAVCQAMALVTGQEPAARLELRSIRSVRFLAPLLDGDELTLTMTATRSATGGREVTARGTRSDGTTAVRLRAGFEISEAGHA